MKLKISEMFDSEVEPVVDTDLIDVQDDYNIDESKIQKLVRTKINAQFNSKVKSKKITKRITLIASVVVALLMMGVAANAATEGKLFGAILLTKENRHIADDPNYATAERAEDGTNSEAPDKRNLTSNIINNEQLQTLNANSITNIPLEKDEGGYVIPEILTTNGDLVILTKEDEKGWFLNKTEQLTIQFKLDLNSNDLSDPLGEWMEIGLIKNGELVTGYTKKASEFTYTITADEEGEYYFYTQNYSAGTIIISSGSVN